MLGPWRANVALLHQAYPGYGSPRQSRLVVPVRGRDVELRITRSHNRSSTSQTLAVKVPVRAELPLWLRISSQRSVKGSAWPDPLHVDDPRVDAMHEVYGLPASLASSIADISLRRMLGETLPPQTTLTIDGDVRWFVHLPASVVELISRRPSPDEVHRFVEALVAVAERVEVVTTEERARLTRAGGRVRAERASWAMQSEIDAFRRARREASAQILRILGIALAVTMAPVLLFGLCCAGCSLAGALLGQVLGP